MATDTQPSGNMLMERLFTLPRELRDMIYANYYADSAPVSIEDIVASTAPFLPEGEEKNPAYTSEVLEAYYTYNTFNVTFSKSSSHDPWTSPHPHCHEYIQKLNVYACELGREPYESVSELGHPWPHWISLLKLPRLKQLTIFMQKQDPRYFNWRDFSPILIELHNRLPELQTSLKMSFDALMERFWFSQTWEDTDGNAIEQPYDPMGFADITELIAAPTEEDIRYAVEFCSGQKGDLGREITLGLIGESASQRRVLALHYVVKEPASLRVRMMEHYHKFTELRRTDPSNPFIDGYY